jgi:hypothetical protein
MIQGHAVRRAAFYVAASPPTWCTLGPARRIFRSNLFYPCLTILAAGNAIDCSGASPYHFEVPRKQACLYLLHAGKWPLIMRRLFVLAALAMAGCSSDPLGARDPLNGHDPLNGRLVENGSATGGEQSNYPSQTLKEQTFVLSNPIPYESKRDATSDDIHTATKLAAKIGRSTGSSGLIAVPVTSAQGATTFADVMVYDASRHSLVNETVYRFSYTPPPGQTLQLDGTTAVFRTSAE